MEEKIWDQAQEWESSWWGDCTNTLREELKQIEYAHRMGLKWTLFGGKQVIDGKGKDILDIGCGPVSMLLKTVNAGIRVGVDPCDYPKWVEDRYMANGIRYSKLSGEDVTENRIGDIFDEVWIYNVLQHTKNPKKIIENAKKIGKVLRIFEWLEVPADSGHLHVLYANELEKWIGQHGNVEAVSQNGANGLAFFGVFDFTDNEEI